MPVCVTFTYNISLAFKTMKQKDIIVDIILIMLFQRKAIVIKGSISSCYCTFLIRNKCESEIGLSCRFTIRTDVFIIIFQLSYWLYNDYVSQVSQQQRKKHVELLNPKCKETLEKTPAAIQNVEFRVTGNIGYNRQNDDKQEHNTGK